MFSFSFAVGEHTIDVVLQLGELGIDVLDNEPVYLHGEGRGVVSLLLLSLLYSTLHPLVLEFEFDDLLLLDTLG